MREHKVALAQVVAAAAPAAPAAVAPAQSSTDLQVAMALCSHYEAYLSELQLWPQTLPLVSVPWPILACLEHCSVELRRVEKD